MTLRQYLILTKTPVNQFARDMAITGSWLRAILAGSGVPSRKLAQKIEEKTEGAVRKEELVFGD